MIDPILLKQLIAAVANRQALANLPDGLRQHAEDFEQMCLEDLRAQFGIPDLTVDDLLIMIEQVLPESFKENDQSRDSPQIPPWLQLAGEVAWATIKKQWPAATWVSVLSAATSYVISLITK